ncbi:MAG: dihydrofolate reductase family protein [Actinomycetales bacterium]
MARFVFGLNQSLDGYVDHDAFAPGPKVFRHFIEQTRSQTGCVYGRRMYEIMRYWDDDDSGWSPDEQAFAEAWRSKPKWVVSRSLSTVGPNATLLHGDLEQALRTVKAEHEGDIEVAGPVLANSVAELGLIDEYQIYLHPVVVGQGTTFFAGSRPTLRLTGHVELAEGVLRLTYAPR